MKKIDFFFLITLLFAVTVTAIAQNENVEDCALPAPQNLMSPTQNPTFFTLKWDAVPLAQLYHVEVTELASGATVASFETDTTFVVIDGLTPGTVYKVGVSTTACPESPIFGDPTVIFVPTSIIIVDIIIQRDCPGGMTEQSWQNNQKVYNLASNGSQTQQIEVYNSALGGGKYKFFVTPSQQNLEILPLDSLRWYGENMATTYRVLDANVPQFQVSYLNQLNNMTQITVTRLNAGLRLRSGLCAPTSRDDGSAAETSFLSASPNPFTDFIAIPSLLTDDEYPETLIFGLDGTIRYHGHLSAPVNIIRTESWPQGVYFLKTSQHGTTRVQKLLKVAGE